MAPESDFNLIMQVLLFGREGCFRDKLPFAIDRLLETGIECSFRNTLRGSFRYPGESEIFVDGIVFGAAIGCMEVLIECIHYIYE